MSEWKEKPDAPGLWWNRHGTDVLMIVERDSLKLYASQIWPVRTLCDIVTAKRFNGCKWQGPLAPVEDAPRIMTDAQIQSRVEARRPPSRSGADAEGKG